MFKTTITSLFITATLALSPASAQSPLSLDDVAKVTVLPGWRTDQGTHYAAIRIEMAEGWKTYWRSAGESGITPRFDWSGSDNLGDIDVLWPIPKVFDPDASRSYGYKGVVVIPLELTPTSPGVPITLTGKLDIGVCSDICLPMSVDVLAELPSSGTPDAAIDASLAHRPASAADAGLRSAKCSVEPISDGIRVTADLNLPAQGGDEIVVFELADQSVWIAEAQSTRRGAVLAAVADFVPANAAPFPLDGSQVRMTVFGSKGVVDIQGCTIG